MRCCLNGVDRGASDRFTVQNARESFSVQVKYTKDGQVLAESEIETVKEALIKSGCARGREIFSADCTKNLPAC